MTKSSSRGGGDLYFPDETTAQIENAIRAAATGMHVPIKSVVFCTPKRYLKRLRKAA